MNLAGNTCNDDDDDVADAGGPAFLLGVGQLTGSCTAGCLCVKLCYHSPLAHVCRHSDIGASHSLLAIAGRMKE
jgi:hypothetical protein